MIIYFKKILNISEDKAPERIDQVAGWKITMKEHNTLLSLLKNNMDHVANKYSDFFIPEAEIDVFIFAIKNENSIFLKHALVDSIFSISMLANERIIKELLHNLQKGSRLEL